MHMPLLGWAIVILLVSVGVVLLQLALGSSQTVSPALWSWSVQAATNVGAAVLTVCLISFLDSRQSGRKRVSESVSQILSDWAIERPTPQFKSLMQEARTVQICGVCLYRSLVGHEWFVEALAARVRDPQRKTEILLMDPDCMEIKRREKEGRGRNLVSRTRDAIADVNTALDRAGISGETRDKFFRLYDYSPTVDFLRFDDIAYVVLLVYGRGAESPALQLTNPHSPLFLAYVSHFEGMWEGCGKDRRLQGVSVVESHSEARSAAATT